jgi:hypothetical protein
MNGSFDIDGRQAAWLSGMRSATLPSDGPGHPGQKVAETCGGGCSGGCACGSPEQSAAGKALSWAEVQSAQEPSAFWRMAKIASSVRTAPGRDGSGEWAAIDNALGFQQRLWSFVSQGSNAAGGMVDQLGSAGLAGAGGLGRIFFELSPWDDPDWFPEDTGWDIGGIPSPKKPCKEGEYQSWTGSKWICLPSGGGVAGDPRDYKMLDIWWDEPPPPPPPPICCCPERLVIKPHLAAGKRSFALDPRASPNHANCVGVQFDVDFGWTWKLEKGGPCKVHWGEKQNLGKDPDKWKLRTEADGRNSPTFNNWRRFMNPAFGDAGGGHFAEDSAAIEATALNSHGAEQTLTMHDSPCLPSELGSFFSIDGHIEIEPGCPGCKTLVADWHLTVILGKSGAPETILFVQSTSQEGVVQTPYPILADLEWEYRKLFAAGIHPKYQ